MYCCTQEVYCRILNPRVFLSYLRSITCVYLIRKIILKGFGKKTFSRDETLKMHARPFYPQISCISSRRQYWHLKAARHNIQHH